MGYAHPIKILNILQTICSVHFLKWNKDHDQRQENWKLEVKVKKEPRKLTYQIPIHSVLPQGFHPMELLEPIQ